MATSKRESSRAAFWRQAIGEQAASGVSVRAWCARRRLKQATFYWWRWELARRAAAGRRPEGPDAGAGASAQDRVTPPAASFVPVHVLDDGGPSARGHIEIVPGDGWRVHVAGRVDRQGLADVLELVAARCVAQPGHEAC